MSAAALASPVLARVTRRTAWVTPSRSEIDRARVAFEQHHAAFLPRLVDGDLLTFLQSQMEADGFAERVHDGLANRPVDLALKPGRAAAVLMLLLNNAAVLSLARRITGRAEIQSFKGSVHRRIPGAGHNDEWHNDLVDGRIAALTINLSTAPYKGGVLQIRAKETERVVFEFANTGPGDAVLFELGPHLQHQVTNPEGRVARTVCAGWFRPQPVREFLGLGAPNQ